MNIVKKIALGLLVVIVLVAAFIGIRLNTLPTEVLDLSTLETPQVVSAEELAKNKELVTAYYHAVSSSDGSNALAQYLAKDYIEHQNSAQYSREGLEAYLKQRMQEYPQRSVNIHRTVAQGDLVFLHVEETLDDTQSMARGELFRLADGKIIEHWSAEQSVPKEAANDNGMFAGAVPNLESTAGVMNAKKAVVDAFEAWENFNTERVLASTTERYIQHNPEGKSGVDNFVKVIGIFKVLRAVTGEGVKITTYRTISEGDFIVMQTLSREGGGNKNVFDVVRVDEDGRKDEHWDIIQAIEANDVEKIF